MARLLEPLLTEKLQLANRLVLPPMATNKGNPDGSISEAVLAYYDEKSRGGMGAVLTEHMFIAPEGQFRGGMLSACDDALIGGLTRLAAVIHANGPKVVMQINHAGGAASSEITGREVVAPSALPSPVSLGEETPRALTADEIHDLALCYRAGARRAKTAGFDGIEIHSAHGYLLNQFYSPVTNKRTDEYGGELSHRIRLHLEVIAAVRDEVGDDFPVLLRLGACDYRDGGSTVEDAVTACVAFERAGVDILDISGGMTSYVRPTEAHPEQGYFADVSAAVKRAVSVPVIVTGGITDARVAERLLAEGAADLIGVGRAIMRDSTWAPRALAELRGA